MIENPQELESKAMAKHLAVKLTAELNTVLSQGKKAQEISEYIQTITTEDK